MQTKGHLVEAVVRDCNRDLMLALRREYPEKYPRVCGPANLVQARLRRMRRLGIPLRCQGSGERLELVIGIFCPRGGSSHRPMDHTHLRYYNGAGQVLYIDPVYRLLWGGADRGQLQMEWLGEGAARKRRAGVKSPDTLL